MICGQANTLIDASPDLRHQLTRERIDRVDQVLLTHEHHDHIGGLPELEFYSRLATRQPVTVYAGAETRAAIDTSYGFLEDVLDIRPLNLWQHLDLDGVSYTPLPATHSLGAMGFIIEASGSKVAYFPDTGVLQPAVADALQGLDVLILDATFNGNNWMPGSHNSIDEAITVAHRLSPGVTYLTHLSMHYDEPVTSAELEDKLAPYDGRIRLAYDGLRISL
jgi:phosphoribosyl 1,2-cyclic phosphate phosphodiesterase